MMIMRRSRYTTDLPPHLSPFLLFLSLILPSIRVSLGDSYQFQFLGTVGTGPFVLVFFTPHSTCEATIF